MEISRSEHVKSDLDRLRRKTEGERAAEELWAESVRRYNARQEVESLDSLDGALGRAMGDRLSKPPELQGYTGQAASADLGAAYAEHPTGGGPAA